MKSKRYLFWAIERIFLIFLFLVWLGASIKTDVIVKFESQSVSLDIMRNIFALTAFMVLGADFIMGIMSFFCKKYSGLLGWLMIIISFSSAIYLMINYGY